MLKFSIGDRIQRRPEFSGVNARQQCQPLKGRVLGIVEPDRFGMVRYEVTWDGLPFSYIVNEFQIEKEQT